MQSAPPISSSVPADGDISAVEWEEASFGFLELSRNTGFGIKIRFLLAMFIVAFLPILLLYVFTGNAFAVAFGRGTILILGGILLLTILVAMVVALPIVQPIRRATRDIARTTKEVHNLALEASAIAQEHRTGTGILKGASKRLQGRRNALIRDGRLIADTCTALQPRVTALFQQAQQIHNRRDMELLFTLERGLKQIKSLSSEMANGLEQDTTLGQLDEALFASGEISDQFEEASRQLELGSQQLENAAKSLV